MNGNICEIVIFHVAIPFWNIISLPVFWAFSLLLFPGIAKAVASKS